MKLCPKCSRSPVPFLMVIALSLILGFATWLMAGLTQVAPGLRALAGVAVFIGAGGTLLHYVLSCLRRHCRHTQADGPDHGVMRTG